MAKQLTPKQRMYRKVAAGYAYFMQSPPQQFDDMTLRELQSEYKDLSTRYVALKRKAAEHGVRTVVNSWKAKAAHAKAVAAVTGRCIRV